MPGIRASQSGLQSGNRLSTGSRARNVTDVQRQLATAGAVRWRRSPDRPRSVSGGAGMSPPKPRHVAPPAIISWMMPSAVLRPRNFNRARNPAISAHAKARSARQLGPRISVSKTISDYHIPLSASDPAERRRLPQTPSCGARHLTLRAELLLERRRLPSLNRFHSASSYRRRTQHRRLFVKPRPPVRRATASRNNSMSDSWWRSIETWMALVAAK